MSRADRDRWNVRYQTDKKVSFESPRELIINNIDLIPKHGLALDLAMGLGGNAKLLLSCGLDVIGVDISEVALHRAKISAPKLMAVLGDLHNFYIPPDTFDVILDILYLQRDLWCPMIDGLKIGGIVFIECLTEQMLEIHPELQDQFLLKPGELRQFFSDKDMTKKLEILHYFEGWKQSGTLHPRALSDLIARRIA